MRGGCARGRIFPRRFRPSSGRRPEGLHSPSDREGTEQVIPWGRRASAGLASVHVARRVLTEESCRAFVAAHEASALFGFWTAMAAVLVTAPDRNTVETKSRRRRCCALGYLLSCARSIGAVDATPGWGEF